MRRVSRKKQRGIVLVFSLVILLLITLLGINMVQQNRLQFMMVANSQEQTSSFVDTEGVLALAEAYIGDTRYATWPLPSPIPDPVGTTYTCNKAAGTSNFDQLKPRMLTSTNLGLSAAIIASSNPSVEITRTSCMTIGNVEIECTPDTTQANGWAATEMQCYQTDPAQCSTEIYTLKTILLDSSGSQHVMQSRYAVRCDS